MGQVVFQSYGAFAEAKKEAYLTEGTLVSIASAVKLLYYDFPGTQLTFFPNAIVLKIRRGNKHYATACITDFTWTDFNQRRLRELLCTT